MTSSIQIPPLRQATLPLASSHVLPNFSTAAFYRLELLPPPSPPPSPLEGPEETLYTTDTPPRADVCVIVTAQGFGQTCDVPVRFFPLHQREFQVASGVRLTMTLQPGEEEVLGKMEGWSWRWTHVYTSKADAASTRLPLLQASGKSFVCRECQKKFRNRHGLGGHMRSEHRRLRRLRIVYEDDCMAIIEKPQGLPVTGEGGTSALNKIVGERRTPEEAAMRTRCADLRIWDWAAPSFKELVVEAFFVDVDRATSDAPPTLGGRKRLRRDEARDAAAAPLLSKFKPVHRLDAATGGLLVLAKTHGADVALHATFEQRRAHKTYRCLVAGELRGSGTIDKPIDGRPSVSAWTCVAVTPSRRFGHVTTLDMHPVTGRTHQLRRHCAHLQHPILGDPRYFPRGWSGRSEERELPPVAEPRMFLFALAIELPHPSTEETLQVAMEEPPWFEARRVAEAAEAAAQARDAGDAANAVATEETEEHPASAGDTGTAGDASDAGVEEAEAAEGGVAPARPPKDPAGGR